MPEIRLDSAVNGRAINWSGQSLRLPIRAADCDGRLATLMGAFEPGFRGAPHIHSREDEIFYILEGKARVQIEKEIYELFPGDLLYAPAGLPHQLENPFSKPVELLALLTDGGIETAFLALDKEPDRAVSILAEAGVRIVDSCEARPGPRLNPDATPILRTREEGESVWLAGDTYQTKLSGEETSERVAVVHFDVPSGGGPIPHVHTRDFEAFVILEGEVTLYAGGPTVVGRQGEVAVLPRNIPHAFQNRTKEPSRMLAVVTPSGFERFIRLAGTPTIPGEPPPPVTEQEMLRLRETSSDFGIVLRPEIVF